MPHFWDSKGEHTAARRQLSASFDFSRVRWEGTDRSRCRVLAMIDMTLTLVRDYVITLPSLATGSSRQGNA